MDPVSCHCRRLSSPCEVVLFWCGKYSGVHSDFKKSCPSTSLSGVFVPTSRILWEQISFLQKYSDCYVAKYELSFPPLDSISRENYSDGTTLYQKAIGWFRSNSAPTQCRQIRQNQSDKIQEGTPKVAVSEHISGREVHAYVARSPRRTVLEIPSSS